MNPELLELYKALQPVFRERLGDVRGGDRVYKHYTVFGEELDSVFWPNDDRNEIVYLRQNSTVSTYWRCKNEKGEERVLTDKEVMDTTCLRYPLTVDDSSPEASRRSLYGMVDWKKYYQESHGPDGEIAIYKMPFIEYNEELGVPVKDHPFATGSLTECLLKALAYQEGVKVE